MSEKISSIRDTVSRPFLGQWQHKAGSSEHLSACRVVLGELIFHLQVFCHHWLVMSILNSFFTIEILTLSNHTAILQN